MVLKGQAKTNKSMNLQRALQLTAYDLLLAEALSLVLGKKFSPTGACKAEPFVVSQYSTAE